MTDELIKVEGYGEKKSDTAPFIYSVLTISPRTSLAWVIAAFLLKKTTKREEMDVVKFPIQIQKITSWLRLHSWTWLDESESTNSKRGILWLLTVNIVYLKADMLKRQLVITHHKQSEMKLIISMFFFLSLIWECSGWFMLFLQISFRSAENHIYTQLIKPKFEQIKQ